MSSGKFGWEKANRQEAARRGLPACEPNLTTKAFCPSCGAGGLVIKFAAGQHKTYTCKRCWTNTERPVLREVRVVQPPPPPPKKKKRKRQPVQLPQEHYNLFERLRFGKFKGRAIKDCPTGYLAWLLNNAKLKKSLRRSIEAFLGCAHLQTPPQVGPSSEPIAGERYVPSEDNSCPF